MSESDNRYRGRSSRRSKSYTESSASRHGEHTFNNNSRNGNDSRSRYRSHEQPKKKDEFVPIPRMPAPACGICGQPVIELSTAFAETGSSTPIHFECAIKRLEEQEKLNRNERIIYIGQGKFAVAYYENLSDQKHFKILRTIQWEEPQSERSDWRNTLSGYYSQIR